VVILFCVGFLFFGLAIKANAAVINADGILGQGSYATDIANWPTGVINAQGLNNITSVALDSVHHRLFVSDTGFNNRILVFQLDNNNNITTTTASGVLGACDFTSAGGSGVSSSTFNFSNLAYDSVNSRLFVADGNNNRVMAFNVSTSIPTSTLDGEPALFELGQAFRDRGVHLKHSRHDAVGNQGSR